MYLFHLACEGVINAEPVTFNDIHGKTGALSYEPQHYILSQKGKFTLWPGINGTCHMWDISL